jgi:hypothetical protein
VAVSFGNLQIPAATTRIVLSLCRLVVHDYDGSGMTTNTSNTNGTITTIDTSKTNLRSSLSIFYGMVLAQGILYALACLLEIFSFIPRKSLARRSGLTSQWGIGVVSFYYSYALDKSMKGNVLGPKNIGLNCFAIYCLDSNMPKMHLHGIRIMHSLLLREETRIQLFTKLTNSTKAMAKLIKMLDWSSPEDTTIIDYLLQKSSLSLQQTFVS